MIMTKQYLDESMSNSACSCGKCGNDFSEGMYFYSHCHPTARLNVFYQNGLITIQCSYCEFEIAQILVGD